MKRFKILIIAVALLSILFSTTCAFARRGPGGYGMGQSGMGMEFGSLTDEEFEQIQEERTVFMKDTEALRRDIYRKNLELSGELVNTELDLEKAYGIQKEISSLKARFDLKRLDYRLKLCKVKPGLGAMTDSRTGGRMSGHKDCKGQNCDKPPWKFRGGIRHR